MKNYKSILVFKNPLLERFTHVHPLTPFFLWFPVVLYFFFEAFKNHTNLFNFFGIGLFSFLCWTLVEYLLHRFIFHLETSSPIGQRLHFLIHGLHHADPIDPTRLVMPPGFSIPLGIVIYFLLNFFTGKYFTDIFYPFFILGYLCYDYIHYGVHHFNPKSKIGKFLKDSHMQHHFVNSQSRWGVSSPLWDYVFGTLKEEKKRNLHWIKDFK